MICIVPAKAGAAGNNSLTKAAVCWFPASVRPVDGTTLTPSEFKSCNVIDAGPASGFAYATPVLNPDWVSTKMDCLVRALDEGTPASEIKIPLGANSENIAVPATLPVLVSFA